MKAYLSTEPLSADKTMELLWSRVRRRGDLPGFAKVVSAIIGAMRGDDDREFNMTSTVLQDPALTQKVLRLANSAMYSVFGKGINTVSKAVVVLGTEAIGHLALGLKLVDGLAAASSESDNARAEMERAVLAGHIARQIVSLASASDTEEAVVCSVLHTLGHMMVTFYLEDRWRLVRECAVQRGIDESKATHELLGLELEEIGRNVARRWGLPASLIDTMRDVPPGPVSEPLDHKDWLAAVSTLSARCAAALLGASGPNGDARLDQLAAGYADMVGLDALQLISAAKAAQVTAAEEDAALVRPRKRSEREQALQTVSAKPPESIGILRRGVADMRDALQSANTGQLMSMALEIVFQGLGCSRAIAFLRNQEQSHYAAHMCFGEGVQKLLPRLVFDDAYQPDVFHAALVNDKMIFVENAQDAAFVNKLPRWWKDALPTVRSFTVLPLTLNHHPVGFIYGDWDIAKPPVKIDQTDIAPLNELRMLVVHVMEQRRKEEPLWARKIP